MFDIYDPGLMSGGSTGDANDRVSAFRPKTFVCPTEPSKRTDTAMGWTNYHSNYGSWVVSNAGRRWDGVFGANFPAASAPNRPGVRMAEVTDGTSNTAAFGEVCNGPQTPPGLRIDNKWDCFEFSGSLSPDHPFQGSVQFPVALALAPCW